ncbi:magnesium chelatase [Candidatus Acetothermia bacterium]|nr:MAG: magnesium chelatase [Candidatus Acetothermia bacterium]
MTTAEVAERGEAILREVERAIVGKRPTLELILATLLAGGHVLLEDYPGLAKTLTARCFARVTGLSFRRIQFTPDLLPTDILGTYIFHRGEEEFEFRPGPIFAQLILADEINRATPKTQSALLEAMQEGQVTLEGETRPLPQPFMVIATQNPIEYEGTFPLPEAQLDRFLVRLRFGYPSQEEEVEILRRRLERRAEEVELSQVVDAGELVAMRQALEEVYVDPDLLSYMAALVHRTREHPSVAVGASPRGSLALLKLSRARAALAGRDFVVPDDVKRVAVAALAHRLILSPDLWAQEVRPEEIVQDILARVPVPKVG